VARRTGGCAAFADRTLTRFPLGARVTLAELEDDPHPVLAELRAHEPVSWVPALDAWLVTRRDLVVEAMRDAATFTVDDPRFSTGQVVGQSMLTLDGDEHARHRDPFARAFRRDAVHARFTQLVEDETERLIDGFAADGHAELRRALAGPLAVASTAFALGLERTDSAEVLGWYDAIVASVNAITAGGAPTDAGRTAFAALHERLAPHLDVAGLDVDEAVSNAAVILFGGVETTEGMIANAFYYLLHAPEQLERARADRALLENAVEESLRIEPAAAVLDRYTTRDAELGGVRMGEREKVTLSLAAANRDPAFFPEPDVFDIARGNARHHVAFAHGPHVCVGLHLARLEARVALDRLLARLPRLRLTADEPPRGLVFRKPPALHTAWD
jgi:cytochrome P450